MAEVGADRLPSQRLDVLLQVYAVERQYNNVAFQTLLAVVTVLFTFMIATAGFAGSKCLHAEAFSWKGCEKIPPALEWATPAPVVGLIAFLIATQALLELGGAYVEEIEHELAILADGDRRQPSDNQDKGPNERLLVPQGMRHVVAEAFGRPPFALGPFVAYSLTYGLALAFTVGAASLMPWHPGTDRIVSVIVSALYFAIYVVTLSMLVIIAVRRSHARLAIGLRGRRRSYWSLLYTDETGQWYEAEVASRRPGRKS